MSEIGLRRKRALERWRDYAALICSIVKRRLPDAKVIAFGSVVRGDWTPDSDLDLLVVSDGVPQDAWGRASLSLELKEALGELGSLLEVHYATWDEYLGWYKRFIDVEEPLC
ncbi:MAG: nucleotidyltransferase domain-containing protein [Thermoproteus sp.]